MKSFWQRTECTRGCTETARACLKKIQSARRIQNCWFAKAAGNVSGNTEWIVIVKAENRHDR